MTLKNNDQKQLKILGLYVCYQGSAYNVVLLSWRHAVGHGIFAVSPLKLTNV